MKGAQASLLMIAGLSIAVWVVNAFYCWPLSSCEAFNTGETLVVVVLCGLLVLGGRRL